MPAVPCSGCGRKIGYSPCPKCNPNKPSVPNGRWLTREQVRALYDDFGFPLRQREHFLDEIFGGEG